MSSHDGFRFVFF